MEKYEELKRLIDSIEPDMDQFYNKHNNAAGTRIRKNMQEIKNLAQDIRLEVQNVKNQQTY